MKRQFHVLRHPQQVLLDDPVDSHGHTNLKAMSLLEFVFFQSRSRPHVLSVSSMSSRTSNMRHGAVIV